MTTDFTSVPEVRPLTFTERARRVQLIDVTISLVAEFGYPKVSLARIAEAAQITKAAVLYHFSSKDALLQAAYQQVLEELVSEVSSAVRAAGTADAPIAYTLAMIRHFREHPNYARMIIETLGESEQAEQANDSRWQTLAKLFDTAIAERGLAPSDTKSLALIFGGAIDSIVAAQVRNPSFDTTAAATTLATLVETVLTSQARTPHQ